MYICDTSSISNNTAANDTSNNANNKYYYKMYVCICIYIYIYSDGCELPKAGRARNV